MISNPLFLSWLGVLAVAMAPEGNVARRQVIKATGLPLAASAAAPARLPVVATDRKGVPISAAQWEAEHKFGRTDLVAGLDGEPYILKMDATGKLADYALKAECTHLGCEPRSYLR